MASIISGDIFTLGTPNTGLYHAEADIHRVAWNVSGH